jgi:energy-coupling factor transport system permease protein
MNRLDPRVRLFWSLVGIIILFLIDNILGQLLILIGLLCVILISRISIQKVIHSIRYLMLFLPITFLVHFLFSNQGWRLLNGELLFEYGMLEQPILFTLRLGNLMLTMAFVVHWIRDIDLIDAVYHLLKPFQKWRIAVDDFFQIIFIAVKFFPIVKAQYARLDEGWKVFMPSRETRILERIQRIRISLIPLLIFSFQRAEVLADAISIRGYHSGSRRSYYTALRFGISDWIMFGIAVGSLLAVIKWA